MIMRRGFIAPLSLHWSFSLQANFLFLGSQTYMVFAKGVVLASDLKTGHTQWNGTVAMVARKQSKKKWCWLILLQVLFYSATTPKKEENLTLELWKVAKAPSVINVIPSPIILSFNCFSSNVSTVLTKVSGGYSRKVVHLYVMYRLHRNCFLT